MIWYYIINPTTGMYFNGFSIKMKPRFTSNRSKAMKFKECHEACNWIVTFDIKNVAFLAKPTLLWLAA